MADLISSEVDHRRFHPSLLGFHPAKQDFIKFTRLAGRLFVLSSLFVFSRKTSVLLILTLFMGLLFLLPDDPLFHTIGQYMTFIPLIILGVQVVLGVTIIVVKLIRKKK